MGKSEEFLGVSPLITIKLEFNDNYRVTISLAKIGLPYFFHIIPVHCLVAGHIHENVDYHRSFEITLPETRQRQICQTVQICSFHLRGFDRGFHLRGFDRGFTRPLTLISKLLLASCMADASPKFHPSDLLPPAAAAAANLGTTHDGLAFWQYMAAGSIAGLVEHTSMFPIDTLKTRIQTHSLPCHPPPGLRHALFSLLRVDGVLGLYRGIGAMGLGAGPAHAAYFSVYEVSKRLLLTEDHPNNPAVHATAGVLATIASDAVFTPMDTVKQRLQMGSSPYKGVYDCVRRVLKEEGFRAFYASYRTTVLMNAPFTAVHFATYEAAKRGLMEVSPENVDDERLLMHATAGAAAGALAAAVTTPLDVVKTQLQCQGVCGCEKFSSSSITDVIRAIISRDGYTGLMRGWKPRMLFHAPAAAICWSTYEASKSFFKDLNDKNAAS